MASTTEVEPVKSVNLIGAPASAFKPVKATAPPEWTLWEEANSMLAKLELVAAHYRRLAQQIQEGLMEGERLIGTMPKRP